MSNSNNGCSSSSSNNNNNSKDIGGRLRTSSSAVELFAALQQDNNEKRKSIKADNVTTTTTTTTNNNSSSNNNNSSSSGSSGGSNSTNKHAIVRVFVPDKSLATNQDFISVICNNTQRTNDVMRTALDLINRGSDTPITINQVRMYVTIKNVEKILKDDDIPYLIYKTNSSDSNAGQVKFLLRRAVSGLQKSPSNNTISLSLTSSSSSSSSGGSSSSSKTPGVKGFAQTKPIAFSNHKLSSSSASQQKRRWMILRGHFLQLFDAGNDQPVFLIDLSQAHVLIQFDNNTNNNNNNNNNSSSSSSSTTAASSAAASINTNSNTFDIYVSADKDIAGMTFIFDNIIETRQWLKNIFDAAEVAKIIHEATLGLKFSQMERSGYLLGIRRKSKNGQTLLTEESGNIFDWTKLSTLKDSKESTLAVNLYWVTVFDNICNFFTHSSSTTALFSVDLSRTNLGLPMDHQQGHTFSLETHDEIIVLRAQQAADALRWVVVLRHVIRHIKAKTAPKMEGKLMQVEWEKLEKKGEKAWTKDGKDFYYVLHDGLLEKYKEIRFATGGSKPMQTLELSCAVIQALDAPKAAFIVKKAGTFTALQAPDMKTSQLWMKAIRVSIDYAASRRPESIKEGYLFLDAPNGVLTATSFHWFVLRRRSLLIYPRHNDLDIPEVALDLSKNVKLSFAHSSDYEFTFNIASQDRVLHITCPSKEEKKNWFQAIQNEITASANKTSLVGSSFAQNLLNKKSGKSRKRANSLSKLYELRATEGNNQSIITASPLSINYLLSSSSSFHSSENLASLAGLTLNDKGNHHDSNHSSNNKGGGSQLWSSNVFAEAKRHASHRRSRSAAPVMTHGEFKTIVVSKALTTAKENKSKFKEPQMALDPNFFLISDRGISISRGPSDPVMQEFRLRRKSLVSREEMNSPRSPRSPLAPDGDGSSSSSRKVAIGANNCLNSGIYRSMQGTSDIVPQGSVVIDNGSSVIRAGFSSQQIPSVVFPTSLGYAQRVLDNKKAVLKGLEPRSLGNISDWLSDSPLSPEKWNIVWDDMVQVWDVAFSCELRVDIRERPLLMTEPIGLSIKGKQEMVEILFETFEVPHLLIQSPAILALMSQGLNTGLSVSWGNRLDIVPIANNHILSHASMCYNIGGEDLTTLLSKLLKQEHGIVTSNKEMLYDVRRIKEDICFVAENLNEVSQQITMDSKPFDKEFTFSTGQKLIVGPERFVIPEALFEPSLLQSEIHPIHQLIVECISKCDIDMRKQFYQSIVLSGSTTLFQGFPERLTKEIAFAAPGNIKPKVIASPKRQYASWIGGAMLASLPTFEDICLWYDDYKEYGANIAT